jgi:hypothetical protein
MSSKMKLDWDRKDTKGYTPLMLASQHNNAWLVRYIIDEQKQNPNDPSQCTRAGAPQVCDYYGLGTYNYRSISILDACSGSSFSISNK